jgi:hypothetical protein
MKYLYKKTCSECGSKWAEEHFCDICGLCEFCCTCENKD